MRLFFILLLFSLLANTLNGNQQIDLVRWQTIKTASFDWLLGEWERTNDEKGKQTFELWTKEDSVNYKGLGFTLRYGDTIFQEQLHLLKEEGSWILRVSGPNEKAVDFKMSYSNEYQFMAENKSHDFPTFITYEKKADTLMAIVGNSDTHVFFQFVPRQN